MREYSVLFKWQFNDSERNTWANGWIIKARNEKQALDSGRKKLHKLATSVINRSKLRLAYRIIQERVELFPS